MDFLRAMINKACDAEALHHIVDLPEISKEGRVIPNQVYTKLNTD